jgi:hypothetical protein
MDLGLTSSGVELDERVSFGTLKWLSPTAWVTLSAFGEMSY